jgi:hypothetical protein
VTGFQTCALPILPSVTLPSVTLPSVTLPSVTLPFVALLNTKHVTEHKTLQGEMINGMVILWKLKQQFGLFNIFIEFAASITLVLINTYGVA